MSRWLGFRPYAIEIGLLLACPPAVVFAVGNGAEPFVVIVGALIVTHGAVSSIAGRLFDPRG